MIRGLIIAFAVVAAIIGVTAAVLLRPAPEPAPPAAPTKSATVESRFAVMDGDFALVAPVDGTGQPADMTPYKGKALLVNLWATWCAPCIQELPSLGTLQQDMGGDKFQVVTIAIDERDPAKIAPFLAAHGAGNLPAFIDLNRTLDKAAKVIALPISLLVAPDGRVKAMLTGDACWNSGTALAAVKAFVADGTVMTDELESCE